MNQNKFVEECLELIQALGFKLSESDDNKYRRTKFFILVANYDFINRLYDGGIQSPEIYGYKRIPNFCWIAVLKFEDAVSLNMLQQALADDIHIRKIHKFKKPAFIKIPDSIFQNQINEEMSKGESFEENNRNREIELASLLDRLEPDWEEDMLISKRKEEIERKMRRLSQEHDKLCNLEMEEKDRKIGKVIGKKTVMKERKAISKFKGSSTIMEIKMDQ